MELNENTINVLPDFLANQIAAGEVVQRPESVVKELVENSLDSGADSIAVIVRGAGKSLIHIVDNGKGMSRRDLELAPKRHATSKIKTQEDLERIMSFGFRGEALASISAVASLEIRTKRNSDDHGWSLVSEPMKDFEINPVNCDNGTQVFVRNLFYNVPARKKFLKSDLTEFRYISDTMIRHAIIHFDRRFTFYDNDTMIFDVFPSTQDERIRNVLGKSLEGALLPIFYEDSKIKIDGFIGLPHLAKATVANQFLYINKRAVNSKNLSYAVFSAFEHLLEKNNKPLFAINISLDPERVDVNIHPQKNEVKFDDDRHIFNVLRNSVSDALSSHNLTPEHQIAKLNSSAPFVPLSSVMPDSEDNLLVNKMTGEIISPHQSDFATAGYRSSGGSFGGGTFGGSNFERNQSYADKPRVSAFDALFADIPPENLFTQPLAASRRIEIAEDAVFFQLHNKYLLMQSEIGVLIIDQHNAHERIIYEKAIKMMNKELSNSQMLVFPIDTRISPSQASTARELRQELIDLGYEFEIRENGDLTIKSLPLDIQEGNASNSFLEIVEDYAENKSLRNTGKREALAASFACKSAIKTGKKLSHEEMKNLAKELMKCSMPYVCPHGRPIILEISISNLDKSFKRTS